MYNIEPYILAVLQARCRKEYTKIYMQGGLVSQENKKQKRKAVYTSQP